MTHSLNWAILHWKRTLFFAFIVFVCYKKEVQLGMKLDAIEHYTSTTITDYDDDRIFAAAHPPPAAMNTSLLSGGKKRSVTKRNQSPGKKNAPLANTYDNLTYKRKGIATSESARRRAAKRKKQKAYVQRYQSVAVREMKTYGIPASITLAQGLLESNVGESRLAVNNHNHFGMKCFSRKCSKGHCSNFTDDSHKDFFRIYANAWESYRAHSLLLKNSKRYRSLFSLKRENYKGWARGLKKAGYATDKRYAEKLIDLIEELELHAYDQYQ